MSNFSFDELGRKDLIVGLALWGVLEVVGFGLLPAIGIVPFSDRLRTWFLLSLPLGVGGAFLLGISSRFIAVTNERVSSSGKRLASLMGQVAGGLALFGIVFPFFMVVIEVAAKLAT